MKLPEGKGIYGLNFKSNEIADSRDVNSMFYANYNNALNTLLSTIDGIANNTNYILTGLNLIFDSVRTCHLTAGTAVSTFGRYLTDEAFAFVASAGEAFLVEVPEDTPIAFAANTDPTNVRIDVLEIRPKLEELNSKSRAFRDPITGIVTSSLMNIQSHITFEFQIIQGTPGGGAPANTAGWVKLAEVVMPINSGSLAQDAIRDVRSKSLWGIYVSTVVKNSNFALTVGADKETYIPSAKYEVRGYPCPIDKMSEFARFDLGNFTRVLEIPPIQLQSGVYTSEFLDQTTRLFITASRPNSLYPLAFVSFVQTGNMWMVAVVGLKNLDNTQVVYAYTTPSSAGVAAVPGISMTRGRLHILYFSSNTLNLRRYILDENANTLTLQGPFNQSMGVSQTLAGILELDSNYIVYVSSVLGGVSYTGMVSDDGTTVSFGSQAAILDANVNGNPKLSLIDGDTWFMFYKKSTNNRIAARVCTHSGLVISQGTETELYDSGLVWGFDTLKAVSEFTDGGIAFIVGYATGDLSCSVAAVYNNGGVPLMVDVRPLPQYFTGTAVISIAAVGYGVFAINSPAKNKVIFVKYDAVNDRIKILDEEFSFTDPISTNSTRIIHSLNGAIVSLYQTPRTLLSIERTHNPEIYIKGMGIPKYIIDSLGNKCSDGCIEIDNSYSFTKGDSIYINPNGLLTNAQASNTRFDGDRPYKMRRIGTMLSNTIMKLELGEFQSRQ